MGKGYINGGRREQAVCGLVTLRCLASTEAGRELGLELPKAKGAYFAEDALTLIPLLLAAWGSYPSTFTLWEIVCGNNDFLIR